MYRRVSLPRLAEALGSLRLSTERAAHIGGTSEPIVNSDFKG